MRTKESTNIEEILSLQDENRVLKRKSSINEEKLQSHEQKHLSIKSEIPSLKRKIIDKQSEISDLKSKISGYQKELNILRSMNAENKAKFEDSKKKTKADKDVISVLNGTLKQKIEENETKLITLQKQNLKKDEIIKTLTDQNTTFQHKIRSLEQTDNSELKPLNLKEVNDLKPELDKANEEISSLNQLIALGEIRVSGRGRNKAILSILFLMR